LSDELVSFKLVAYQEVSQIDYNNMEFFKALEAATNVHIDFECLPASSLMTRRTSCSPPTIIRMDSLGRMVI